MFIYVKVDPANHPRGTSVKQMAWRAWELGGLLTNPALRNNYKFLIVISSNVIIATFCIHGVALDSVIVRPKSGRKISLVRFAIVETTKECFDSIVNCIPSTLLKKWSRRSFGYIDINCNQNHCNCILSIIPLYNTTEIVDGDIVI